MQKITPFLWFNGRAEEAATFYTGIFKNAKITEATRWGDAGPGPKGRVISSTFELDGQKFIALNCGPQFKFSEAISFFVSCDTQEGVDRFFWEKLSEGGETIQCGWLKDKFGATWQVVPKTLGEMLRDKNPAKSQRVMKAMMQMKKLDIAGLKAAYHQA